MKNTPQPAGCGTCLEYAERRLPTVLRLWSGETGQKVHVTRFMAGVHRRHLAGLPVVAAAAGTEGGR
jgi:hypothetical protein